MGEIAISSLFLPALDLVRECECVQCDSVLWRPTVSTSARMQVKRRFEEVRRFGRGRFISRLLNLARYPAPPCTALPSTRLEARSRLALPSPPLYRTTRARHGARGLPRLFPGRRCALRPASCCLSAAGRNQPHTRRRHASASRPAGIAYEPTNRTDPTGTATFPLTSLSPSAGSATDELGERDGLGDGGFSQRACRVDHRSLPPSYNAIEHEYHNAISATRLALDSTLQWTVYWCLSNSDTLGVCNAGAYRHRDHSWISFNAQGTDEHRFHELRTYPLSLVSPGCELHICHGRQSFPARPVKCLPPLPMEFGAPASIWAIKRNGCCIQEICHGRPKARWVVCEAQPHDSPLSLGAGKLPGEVSKASTCVSGGTA